MCPSYSSRLGINSKGDKPAVLGDIGVAAVIVALAALLGLAVTPLLWLIAVLAIVWLFARAEPVRLPELAGPDS